MLGIVLGTDEARTIDMPSSNGWSNGEEEEHNFKIHML